MRSTDFFKLSRYAAFYALVFTLQTSHADNPESHTASSSWATFDSTGHKCLPVTEFFESSVSVDAPGTYCLFKNIDQTDFFRGLARRSTLVRLPGSAMVEVNSGAVKLDLMGKQLTSDMELLAGLELPLYREPGNQNIEIRNGKISKIGRALVVMPARRETGEDKRFLVYTRIGEFHADISAYPATDFVLENLTLEGNNEIIVMQGRRNIIRNCKIIGGNSTVNLMGPNMIFENNEIIFNAKEQTKAQDGPPFALYLEDAAGSTIRNNRITILSHDVPGTAAIVLKNSANVTIMENTVAGVPALYKALDAQSTVIEQDNHVSPSVNLADKLRYSVYHH